MCIKRPIVSKEIRKILFYRGALLTMADEPKATILMERITPHQKMQLIQDFGFDFEHPSFYQGIEFYSYDLEKAKKIEAIWKEKIT